MEIINLDDINKNYYYLYSNNFYIKINNNNNELLKIKKDYEKYKIENNKIYCDNLEINIEKNNDINYNKNFDYNNVIIYNNFIKDLLDIIIYYIYKYENDKLNKLFDIIKKNYLYLLKYNDFYNMKELGYNDDNTEYFKYKYVNEICFNKNIFLDIFLLNLNCDILFDCVYYNKVILYHELTYNHNVDDFYTFDEFILKNKTKLIMDIQEGYKIIKNKKQIKEEDELDFYNNDDYKTCFIINCRINDNNKYKYINFLINNNIDINYKNYIIDYIKDLNKKINNLEELIINYKEELMYYDDDNKTLTYEDLFDKKLNFVENNLIDYNFSDFCKKYNLFIKNE